MVTPVTNPSGGSTPGPAPGPTPSTFSFTQQYYAAFITASSAPYTQSGLLAYSWGSRTRRLWRLFLWHHAKAPEPWLRE